MNSSFLTSETFYLTTRNSKPSGQETVLFLMRSCSIQSLVLHSDNEHMQNQHHVICGVAHGGE